MIRIFPLLFISFACLSQVRLDMDVTLYYADTTIMLKNTRVIMTGNPFTPDVGFKINGVDYNFKGDYIRNAREEFEADVKMNGVPYRMLSNWSYGLFFIISNTKGVYPNIKIRYGAERRNHF